RQDEHLRLGHLGHDPLGRLDPVHAGHAHVHEDDVRTQRDRLAHGGATVVRLADHLEIVLGLEHHAKAHADERLVVGEQQPRHLFLLGSHPPGAAQSVTSAGAPSSKSASGLVSAGRVRAWPRPAHGSSACPRQPEPHGPAATTPPYTPTRSRIPITPRPVPPVEVPTAPVPPPSSVTVTSMPLRVAPISTCTRVVVGA